jgi:7-cyano-7-deazaguanine synthase
MKVRSVVLLSGGLDSAANLKKAADDSEVVRALTFDYGQRSADLEIRASRAMCEGLKIPHEVVPMPWLEEITQTALVRGDAELPAPEPDVLDDPEEGARRAAQVWVPNRNGVFVAVGASFAESLGADAVVAGFNAEEGKIFPDNSLDFISAYNRLLGFSTLSRVKLISHTASLGKADIVRLALSIGAPLGEIWSCYGGGPAHCGRCESCRRLVRAFEAAGAEAHLPPFQAKYDG